MNFPGKYLGKFFLLTAYCGAGTIAMGQGIQDSQIEASRAFERERFRDASFETLRAEEEEDGAFDAEIPASEGDADIGSQRLLREQQRYKAFSIFSDAGGFYTTNVALASDGAEDDFFFVGTVGASWNPKITNELFVDVGARQQFYRYDEFSELDFDSLNLSVGVTYVAKELDNLISFARYNYNRLTNMDGDEFFANHTIDLGLFKPWQLDRAQRVFVGFNASLGFADPDDTQRNEFSLYAGYDARISRWFQLSLYYNAALNDYTAADGRQDVTQTFSVTGKFILAEWFSIGTTSSLSVNSSNQDVFDYSVLNPGANVNLNYRF